MASVIYLAAEVVASDKSINADAFSHNTCRGLGSDGTKHSPVLFRRSMYAKHTTTAVLSYRDRFITPDAGA